MVKPLRRGADYNPSNIFDYEYEGEQFARNEALSGNISNYRVKETTCGQILEADIYPMPAHGMRKEYNKERERKKTGEAQRKINQRNRQRLFSQLLHANFYHFSNVWATLTYDNRHLPQDYKQAYRDFESYKKRMVRLAERVNEYFWELMQIDFLQVQPAKISYITFLQALKEYEQGKRIKGNFNTIAFYLAQNLSAPMEAIKYLLVVEQSENERFHHHLVINFPNTEIVQAFWKFGRSNSAKFVVPDKLYGLAGYLSKDYKYKKEYEKSFTHSRNLHMPHKSAKMRDRKAGKRTAGKIANDKQYCYAWFAQNYPGYELVGFPEVRTNEYFGGYWIYARLKRME
ncbi:MAG: hypothetical protein FWE47_00100 [Oscillospiraceae bacterium]|nr:hypothetical protein [Oscillospiraceae bacterium]